jgi:predicted DNA binding CopG/RHH family protein
MAGKLKLTAEERDILKSYEGGEWKSVTSSRKRLDRYQSYATLTLEANGLISIVLPPNDLKAIRRKAAENGVPYQLLIAKIVHQFIAGHWVDKPDA